MLEILIEAISNEPQEGAVANSEADTSLLIKQPVIFKMHSARGYKTLRRS